MNKLFPHEAINKSYRRIQIDHDSYERFLDALEILVGNIHEDQHEVEQKGILTKFFHEAFYRDYNISPVDDIDLAIRLDRTSTSNIGVMFECKGIVKGRREMPTVDNLNTKAVQELILYYLRQRKAGNTDIRHLIVTNTREFFIFDAQEFERLFYKNTSLIKRFNEFEARSTPSSHTDFFYNEIAAPVIEQVQDNIRFTFFSLKDYRKEIRHRETTGRLTHLYRLLSPVHLLKQPFQNDSNTLNEQFYRELLYLIGLEEFKEGNKSLIRRRKISSRNEASLLENTINILKTESARIPQAYGETYDERLFNVALELCVTWINRILFLKLLEAQLFNYHKNKNDYRFLTYDKIPDFDGLNRLFFQVMAVEPAQRNKICKTLFPNVPYLNSSLFEPTNLERTYFRIHGLEQDGMNLPIMPRSVLRNDARFAHRKSLAFLDYLFAFLDAYNFSSEGNGDVAEKPKTLINASVLGLIFEKINGYKDGAVFTPGYITRYMCESAIRQAVLNKFNAHFGWNLDTFDSIKNENFDRQEANELINSLRICDPAVGSGHFLVSALNEIILIKSELGCLFDTDGMLIKSSDYEIVVENDELIITDFDGELWSYKPNLSESRRIQEAIFNEKRTIIENCLFGVDINPNSVNICRLRLWIELLKNAYYTKESGYTQLETLPNIDINIKRGDSLLQKFNLSDSFVSPNIRKYKDAVKRYKQTKDKDDKIALEDFIDEFKKNLSAEICDWMKVKKDLVKAKKVYYALYEPGMFGLSDKDKKRLSEAKKALEKAQKAVDDAESDRIYGNGFEWRMEFPEVLDDKGSFQGFDLVIGNPPYIQLQSDKGKLFKLYNGLGYYTCFGTGDIYCLFYELGYRILKPNGILAFINSNTWLQSISFSPFRKFVTHNFEWDKILITEKPFDAVVDTHCIQFTKSDNHSDCDVFIFEDMKPVFSHTLKKDRITDTQDCINIISTKETTDIIEKIFSVSIPFKSLFKVYNGVKPFEKGKGTPPQTEEIVKEKPYVKEGDRPDNSWTPLLRGSLIYRYSLLWNNNYWIQYGPWLAAPRKKEIFEEPEKIVVRQTGDSIIATIIDDTFICRDNLHVCIPNRRDLIKYALGILNSKLIDYVFTFINPEKGEALAQVKKAHIEKIPFKINDSFITEISKLVDSIITEKKTGKDCTSLLNRIDLIVYHIYGLTYNEVLIIDPKTTIRYDEYTQI